MLQHRQAYYTVTVDPDTAELLVKEADAAGTDVLSHLRALLEWSVGRGACIHPPALVEDGGIPQCLGCGAWL